MRSALLGLGLITTGAFPALAEETKRTYATYLDFLTNDGKFNFFLAHGYNLWIAWFGLGMAQVASTRYLKTTNPELSMWVHRISGSLMVLLTGWFGGQAITTVNKVINNEHSYFVFPMLILVVLAAAMGALTDYQQKENKWNTAEVLSSKMWHKIPAYSVLGAGFFAIYYGIYYYRISPKHYSDFPLENLEALLFFLVAAGAELLY